MIMDFVNHEHKKYKQYNLKSEIDYKRIRKTDINVLLNKVKIKKAKERKKIFYFTLSLIIPIICAIAYL